MEWNLKFGKKNWKEYAIDLPEMSSLLGKNEIFLLKVNISFGKVEWNPKIMD